MEPPHARLGRWAKAVRFSSPAEHLARALPPPRRDMPALFGIPVDFILFALTLIGVAVFHHHTLQVALTGLATIVVYKLAFTGFKTGAGLAGLAGHMHHEWVILDQPAVPARRVRAAVQPFREEPRARRPAPLPPGRLEGLLRAARDDLRAVELSRQHRRGADRRRDGCRRVPPQGSYRLPCRDRRRFQRRRLGQRGRRHHHHHDVARRREPDQRARCVCRRGGRSRHLRHPGLDAAAALLADHEGRAAACAGGLARGSASSRRS